MSELRQDPVSGCWVIMAPDRAQRPHASRAWIPFEENERDPFAEGHEQETPGELFAIRHEATLPDSPGWSVRVIPNKFPAVERAEFLPSVRPDAAQAKAFYRQASGHGPHEVIVECPQAESCISRLSVEQARLVLQTYHQRLNFHRLRRSCQHALIFKNKGVSAGATLPHSHSQLIGTPWVPPLIETELQRCRKYFLAHDRCLLETLVEQELEEDRRIVETSEHFVVFCPYASRVSFEVWIVPRQAGDAFELEEPEVVMATADILHRTLQRLQRLFPDLPYNFYLHSAPFRDDTAAAYRWHFEILPRMGSTAGFEWGGGSYINAVLPEFAAGELRKTL